MDEILKILGSGQPVWVQVVLICIAFGIQYLAMKKKASDSLTKEKKSLREKHLLMHSAAESFFNEKYHIKKKVFVDQRTTASRILQNFTNDLCSVYEQRLQQLEIDTRDAELLILAFDGFLSRVKEEIMNHVEDFIASRDFESDNYSDTEKSLSVVSNQISLHLNNVFRKRYSEKRYKVKFSNDIISSRVAPTLKDIYEQAKDIYDSGESKIDNLKRVYEERTSAIIGGV